MRICKNCNIEKILEEFYKHPRMLEGRYAICKECTKKKQKEYYKEYYPKNAKRIYQCKKKGMSVRENYSDAPNAIALRKYYQDKLESSNT